MDVVLKAKERFPKEPFSYVLTWIDHVMKEKNLYKKMSKGELYKTLDQMKLYELATGETMLGEISKKQKDIFSAFKISKNIKPSKKI